MEEQLTDTIEIKTKEGFKIIITSSSNRPIKKILKWSIKKLKTTLKNYKNEQ